MTSSSGHWVRLACYSLALLNQDRDSGRPGPPSSPPSNNGRSAADFLQSLRRFLLRAACAVAAVVLMPSAVFAADPPTESGESAAAESDDSCAELFGWMYWTHRDEGVYRACRDGSQVKLLVPIKSADGLAVDPAGGKLYFTTSVYPQLNGDKLWRANLDGSGAEELIQGLNFTGDLVLDREQRKLYVSSLADGKILRCNLDGAERQDWLSGVGNPDEMALDPERRQLYWVRSGKIQRANLDDPHVEDVVQVNAVMMGLALDLKDRRLFYATRDNGSIISLKLDGGGQQPLIKGRVALDGLAYDPLNRKLYWTETGKICQANDDGSQAETLVPDKTHQFSSLVILPPEETP